MGELTLKNEESLSEELRAKIESILFGISDGENRGIVDFDFKYSTFELKIKKTSPSSYDLSIEYSDGRPAENFHTESRTTLDSAVTRMVSGAELAETA